MTETVIVPPGPSMKRVRGTKKFLGLKEWNLKKDLGLHFLRACSRSVWRCLSSSSSSSSPVPKSVPVPVSVARSVAGPVPVPVPVPVSVSVSVSPGEDVVEVLVDVTDDFESGGGSPSADAVAGEGTAKDTVTTRAMERDPVRAGIADLFIDRRPFCRLRMVAALI
ncbi:hypothetical protein [Streptosporangium sp. NBC_01469]|uniref:hypothetical protein n=1 Tax=Streptosporangium sp. NBC_01469 TaxID=2903898 RepID=UPI002E289391|nr:hypothetical protein [Streptosporangium sp. NBC_01469]